VTLDPIFLARADVEFVHADQLATHGGTDGVRDAAALESAIGAPQASFGGEYLHEDLFHMAAAYAFHIAEAQAYLDGNKRTGLGAALLFLELNGIALREQDELLATAMLDIAARRASKADLADLFRRLAGEQEGPSPTSREHHR
jgi:death-on-curing protein